jgi:leader peptidase (prepilin peptidase)/N-methyltransferase
MIGAVGKTFGRTRLFLGQALRWRGTQRQYAPIAWSLVAGWIWLLAGLRGEPAWPAIVLAGLYLSGLLAAVCAVDARYGIIPDTLVIALAAGGLVQLVVIAPSERLLQRLVEAGLFFVVAWLFRAGYHRLRGYHGLGLGDVKLAAAAMLWIGISAAPGLLIIAVLSALASLLIVRAGGQKLHRLQAISFGPHLAIGIWLCWLVEILQGGFGPLWY